MHLRCLTPSVARLAYTSTRGGRALSESLRNRFEAKVDRSSEHYVLTGSRTSDGGELKVDGKTVSARRVAWELARGALAVGVVVKACPEDQACVRVEHLALRGESPAANRRRAPRGTGSKTEIRPGVWKLTVTSGLYADGGCAGCIAPCRPTPKRRQPGSLRPSLPRFAVTRSQTADRTVT